MSVQTTHSETQNSGSWFDPSHNAEGYLGTVR